MKKNKNKNNDNQEKKYNAFLLKVLATLCKQSTLTQNNITIISPIDNSDMVLQSGLEKEIEKIAEQAKTKIIENTYQQIIGIKNNAQLISSLALLYKESRHILVWLVYCEEFVFNFQNKSEEFIRSITKNNFENEMNCYYDLRRTAKNEKEKNKDKILLHNSLYKIFEQPLKFLTQKTIIRHDGYIDTNDFLKSSDDVYDNSSRINKEQKQGSQLATNKRWFGDKNCGYDPNKKLKSNEFFKSPTGNNWDNNAVTVFTIR